jgi:hypothetical protein
VRSVRGELKSAVDHMMRERKCLMSLAGDAERLRERPIAPGIKGAAWRMHKFACLPRNVERAGAVARHL